MISNYNRSLFCSFTEEEVEVDRLLINEVASINLVKYLKNKKKLLSLCLLKPITDLNIITLGDLIQANEHEKDKKIVQAMRIVIGNFPKSIINIASCFNENLNSDSDKMEFLMTTRGQWTKIGQIPSVKLRSFTNSALKNLVVTLEWAKNRQIDVPHSS